MAYQSIQYTMLYYYLLIASFNALPALNLGAFDAGIGIVSPVCGFLPSLAALSTTSQMFQSQLIVLYHFFLIRL